MRSTILLAVASFLVSCLHAQTSTTGPTATPSSVSFTWQTGAALPPAQTVAIKSGSSTAAYTTSIGPGTALWISVTPDTGVLPASLSVQVNPSSLVAGTYSASLVVVIAGVSAPLMIPVTLTVVAAPPTLTVSASTLSFVSPPSVPAAQTIQLTTSNSPVAFGAAVQGATWLSITPSSGVVLPGAPATLTVSVNSAGLTPQSATYSGKITITAAGVPASNKTQTVSVSLLVNALTPTITSLWPSAALIGSGALTVTIRGTGFYKATTAMAVGVPTPLVTTVLSADTLLAAIPATLTAAAGTLNMEVTNPAPGGPSTPLGFTVSSIPVVQTVVSAATYQQGPISPGELVTLFGSQIGPTAPLEMLVAAGFVATVLGSVSVTIDGIYAPIIYASTDQITVQAPYGISIGTARSVLVTNGGVVAAGQVDTALTAPGLFSLDATGIGQAAALTFSMKTSQYSVNGSTSPLNPGDIAILYLTGEGDYASASIPVETGYVISPLLTPLPQVNPLPVVTIGGAPATVQYAGPVAGSILGVLQINAVVPAGSTTGNATPVSVAIGGVSTQAGVTIAVK